VRVTFLDRAQVLRALAERVAELAARAPELETAVLFGSLARGRAVPGSDADLLLVLSHSDLPWLERLSRYAVRPAAGVAVEVFPYTRAELDRMRAEGNQFVRRALEEGQVLFERAERLP